MDFKSILSKLDSMDAPVVTPAAPKLPEAVQLNEDAQLRVLSGRTTYVSEAALMEKAKSVAQQQAAGAALAAKRGEGKAKGASKEMSKMDTKELEKFASTKHKGLPKKKTEESVEEAFDSDSKVGDTFKTGTGGTATKTKTGIKHTAGGNYGAEKQPFDKDEEDKPAKKTKKVKESAKPDFLDVDKDGDKKEPMKKAAAEKGGDKKDGKKGMSDKQAKYFGKKTESAMMPKGKKRPVKESVEGALSFKECIQLVRESGGQQQIDPLDKELFAWAQRVAASKFTESVQQDAFAGVTYERMGGRFQLYDVLAESKK